MIEFRALGTLDLRDSEGRELRSLLTRTKRLALLAYLALARPHGFHRRDTLVALLWPELDQEHARSALRQSLHYLREALGPDVITTRGEEEVGLDSNSLWCDALAFEESLEAERLAEALELYRGDLLAGFHISEAPEFDRWLDEERDYLRRGAGSAACRLAEEEERKGNRDGGLNWARRAAALSTYDEKPLRSLLSLLDRAGDRTAAIRTYEEFAQRLAKELDVEPSPETKALIEAIKARVQPVAELAPSKPERLAPASAAPSPDKSLRTSTADAQLPGTWAINLGGVVRSLRRSRLLVGSVVALGLLGVAIAGWIVARTLEFGFARSLVAAGTLERRDRIVLADFETQTGDSLLAFATTEAFRVDMSQSPLVTIVEPDYVARVLRRMQQDSIAGLDYDRAREVAVREALKAVIAGEVNSVGAGYVVSARLVRAETGEVVWAGRETARDSTAVIPAIDRLSEKLRRRIGESLLTIRRSPALEDVTTASLSALRKYSEAGRAGARADFDRATVLYEEAIDLDTTFAAAYEALGILLLYRGQRGASFDAVTRAYELRERLTEQERYAISAVYHVLVTGDMDQAFRAQQALVEVSDSTRGLNNLGVLYSEMRLPARSEQLYERLLATDSFNATAYANLFRTKVNLGKFDEAEKTLERWGRNVPGHALRHSLSADLAVYLGDYAAAESRILARRQAGSTPQSRRVNQAAGSFQLGVLRAHRGKLAQGRLQLRQAAAAFEGEGRTLSFFKSMINLALIDVAFKGNPAAGIHTVDSALRRRPLRTIDLQDRPYLDLAEFYALAGRPDQARAFLGEYEVMIGPSERSYDEPPAYHRALATVAAAEGRSEEAIRQARMADTGECLICALPMLGRAYELAGASDSAIAVYERYVTTPHAERALFGYDFSFWGFRDFYWLPVVYERLADLYERRGDPAKAAHYYTRLAELWKDADPELRPRVNHAARRLQALGAELSVRP